MSVFEHEFFTLGEAHAGPLASRPLGPDEVLRGDYWSLYRRGGQHVLGFISGELAGREKLIALDGAEAEALIAGTASVEAILIARGTG